MERRFLVGEVKGKDKIVESGKDLVSIYLCLKLLNNKNNKNALDAIYDIIHQKYLVESVLAVHKPQKRYSFEFCQHKKRNISLERWGEGVMLDFLGYSWALHLDFEE